MDLSPEVLAALMPGDVVEVGRGAKVPVFVNGKRIGSKEVRGAFRIVEKREDGSLTVEPVPHEGTRQERRAKRTTH
jgi:hypothetical protein